MTVTLPSVPRSPIAVEQPVAGDGDVAAMLAMLHAVVDQVAWLDPDGLHSRGAAGHALVTLAAAARAAVAVLGAEPGTALHQGPGVVVVRDLVDAVRLLDRTDAGRVTADDRALLAGLTRGTAEARDRFRAFAPAPA